MTFSFTPCCVPQSYHALQKEVLRESLYPVYRLQQADAAPIKANSGSKRPRSFLMVTCQFYCWLETIF